MIIPIKGLKSAMKSPCVVMIRPTDDGATPRPSLIWLRTGAIMLPDMTVIVAEARTTPKENFLESVIGKSLSSFYGSANASSEN